jgi:hypothetical protein
MLQGCVLATSATCPGVGPGALDFLLYWYKSTNTDADAAGLRVGNLLRYLRRNVSGISVGAHAGRFS